MPMNVYEKYWGGLVYSNCEDKKDIYCAFLDGSAYIENWHYSNAPFKLYDDKSFPALSVKKGALWIRIISPFQTCSNKRHFRISCCKAIIALILYS